MAEFKLGVLTAQGTALLAKAQAGTTSINFTKFQIGNGTWAANTAAETLMQATALKAQKGEFGITKAEYVNKATTELTLVASNKDNTDGGFYITEVGVFAKDGASEILYAIYIAESDKADWFPAYNSRTPSSITYSCAISVANAENVTINANSGGIATHEELEKLETHVLNLEMGAAACIGIRRKCQEDGTPQSNTAWERWGQYTDVTVQYARGNEAVQNDLMGKWPYNLLRPCNLSLDSDEPVAYLGDADFDWYGATGAAAGTSVMLEVPTDMYLAHWYEEDASGQNWEYKCVADSGRYPGSVYVKDLMARADGTRKNHFYFPIFLGSLNADGKYVSVAGAMPAYNKSCTAMRTAVKTNGDNWQLIDVWAWEILSDLAEIMSADANFKTTYGLGCSSFGSAFDMAALNTETGTNRVILSNTHQSKLRAGMAVNISNTGSWNASVAQNRRITAITAAESTDEAIEVTLDGEAFDIASGNVLWRGAQFTGATIGMAAPNGTAGANDGIHSNRVLYIEDFFGMLHTGVDGLNLKFNEADMCLEMYVCQDPSKYADAYTDYKLLPEVLPLNADNENNYELSGYIKQEYYFKDYPLLEMPKVVANGAGSNTYLAAHCHKNKNGARPFFGGSFNYGAYVSPRYRNCYVGFSYAHWSYGSRPLRR